jgi:hypothetical protein
LLQHLHQIAFVLLVGEDRGSAHEQRRRQSEPEKGAQFLVQLSEISHDKFLRARRIARLLPEGAR